MTIDRPSDLPDFESPPVAETVLSVQFEPIERMRSVHFGAFWQTVRERYPESEERPALDPVLERFPEPTPPRVGLKIETSESPSIPRFWFLSSERRELMQVQTDRFIKNWRKSGDKDVYPRYETVRASFDEDFERFRKFLLAEELGSVKVNQCELTYVNHIVAGEGWSTHEDVDRVFEVWRQPSAAFPGKAETLAFHARFAITDGSGRPVGRLHADLQCAERKTDSKHMFVLNLTARGFLGQATEFFDLGREWIVRSFAEMTSARMHQVWGRRA